TVGDIYASGGIVFRNISNPGVGANWNLYHDSGVFSVVYAGSDVVRLDGTQSKVFFNYPLNVTGDINITGAYRVNGLPVSGVMPSQGRPGPVSPQEGQLWFDTSVHHLLIYSSGAWFQLT